jgi:hypothetical protein
VAQAQRERRLVRATKGLDSQHLSDADLLRAYQGPPAVRLLTPGQDGRRQGLILGTGRSEADRRDHPPRPDGPAPVEALVPAEAVAPADIGQARQPAGPTTLGLPRRHRRAVQGFVGPLATRQAVPQG